MSQAKILGEAHYFSLFFFLSLSWFISVGCTPKLYLNPMCGYTSSLLPVLTSIIICGASFFFFSLGSTYGMQKFQGQGWNLCRSSDNAGSLTTRLPVNSCIALNCLSKPSIILPQSTFQVSIYSLLEVKRATSL